MDSYLLISQIKKVQKIRFVVVLIQISFLEMSSKYMPKSRYEPSQPISTQDHTKQFKISQRPPSQKILSQSKFPGLQPNINYMNQQIMLKDYLNKVQTKNSKISSHNHKKQMSITPSEDLQIEYISSQQEDPFKPYDHIINRSLYQQLKKQLTQLKQVNLHLLTFTNHQKYLFTEMISKLSRQLTNKFLTHQRNLQEHIHTTNELLRTKMISIQYDLRQKNNQNQLLLRELEQLKKHSSQTQSKLKQQKKIVHEDYCLRCRQLQPMFNSLKQQALQSSQIRIQVQAQNQRLQQKVFDYEQQLIGIDLQVEKRFKQSLSRIPNLTGPSVSNSQITQSLMKSLEKAQSRCKHYQSLCMTQDQLSQRQQQLTQSLLEYQLKNNALLQAITRNEQIRNKSYEKEHELLIAQEELYEKIQNLRNKQIQLSQWETQLVTKNNRQTEKQTSLDQYKEERSYNINPLEQISMKNLGVRQPQSVQAQEYYSDYRVELPINHLKNDRQHETAVREPLKIRQPYSRVTINKEPNYHNSRYSNNIQYSHRRVQTEGRGNSRGSIPITHKLTSSPSSKALYTGHLGYKASHPNTNSKHNYSPNRYTYNRPRNHSPSRSIKSNHSPHFAGRQHPSYNGNYNAAQNKLQRLKGELRRQLQALK